MLFCRWGFFLLFAGKEKNKINLAPPSSTLFRFSTISARSLGAVYETRTGIYPDFLSGVVLRQTQWNCERFSPSVFTDGAAYSIRVLLFLSLIIFFIIIGIVNPLHKCFAIVYFSGKRIIQ